MFLLFVANQNTAAQKVLRESATSSRAEAFSGESSGDKHEVVHLNILRLTEFRSRLTKKTKQSRKRPITLLALECQPQACSCVNTKALSSLPTQSTNAESFLQEY